MNKQIKAKWVRALKSGKYKQGHGQLKNKSKFGCLGVLTDLYIKSHKDTEWVESSFEADEKKKFAVTQAYPAFVVQKWARLRDENPYVEMTRKNVHYYSDLTLADLNDGTTYKRRKSFKDIAALIQAQL